jgi:tetratricopeptide (TPR) repeat protein
MRSKSIVQIIIYASAILMGVYPFFLILQLGSNAQWFQFWGLFLYFVLSYICYWLVLLLLVFIVKFFNTELYLIISRITRGIALFLLGSLVVQFIIGQIIISDFEKKEEQQSGVIYFSDSLSYVKRYDSLDSVIKYDSMNYKAIVQRGRMKRNKGKWAEALLDNKKALKINSNDFHANWEMGYCLQYFRKFKESEIYYRKAANIDTSSYFAKSHPEYLNKSVDSVGSYPKKQ